MNVYEKLVEARIRFMNMNVKMSGQNKFAEYSYFELADILPAINKIAQELKFVCIVSFDDAHAILAFIDTEKDESSIIFKSPMSTAALKGCHEVQNLGAVETYIKRYLYQNAFEIVESDSLNATQGKTEPVQVTTKQPSELVTLKNSVMDWLAVTPPLMTHEQREWADTAAKDNNIANMKIAIEKFVLAAKKREETL